MTSFRQAILLCLSLSPMILMAQTNKPSLQNTAWLAGCWQQGDDPDSVEQWMRPAGNVMMGMSRTIENGKVVAYEFMQIRQDANGDIFYIAKPHNKPETPFKLIKGKLGRIDF